jgi:hypothetical protein
MIPSRKEISGVSGLNKDVTGKVGILTANEINVYEYIIYIYAKTELFVFSPPAR